MHALGGTYSESPVRASPQQETSMAARFQRGVRCAVRPLGATVRHRRLPLDQSVQCAPRSRPTMHSCRCALAHLLQGPPVPTESVHRHFFVTAQHGASVRAPSRPTSAASARRPGRTAVSTRASPAAARPRISISNCASGVARIGGNVARAQSTIRRSARNRRKSPSRRPCRPATPARRLSASASAASTTKVTSRRGGGCCRRVPRPSGR